MPHFYLSQTYVDASARLEEACAWVESLGINYSPTRLGRYQALFADLARYQLSNTLSTFFEKYSMADFFNAAHEAAEICRIHEGLGLNSDSALSARMRNALKGHELYIYENQDRSGRDFSLELAVAAKFALAGCSIDFGSDADIRAEYGNYTFFVECKRLKSKSKVHQRIKDGQKQLRKRFVASKSRSSNRGILVLSVAKLLNPDLGYLEASTPSLLSERAFSLVEEFIKQHQSHWQPALDHRILGVAVMLDSPGVLSKNKQVVTCHEVAINSAIDPNTTGHKLLLDVANNVFQRRT